MGSTVKLLSRTANLLASAMARKIGGVQYIWTCRQIGVNSAGNNDNPPAGTGPADRSAVEWFKIQTTPSVSISASGRIYDQSTPPNQKFYLMPSLAVNSSGDMLVGFSGSSVNDFVSVYYTGRLYSGASPANPIRFIAGKDWFGSIDFPQPAWGDYSHTSLDPDGNTIWTIQEYAETRYDSSLNAWGTWIVAVTRF